MKTLTYITIDPTSDSYDIIAVDDIIMDSGDDYHDKIYHKFQGIKLYLNSIGEEYTVVKIDFPPHKKKSPYEHSPQTKSLKTYLTYLKKHGYKEIV
jgi:hypothetical protein